MKNYTIDIDHDQKIVRYKHNGNLVPDDIGEVWDKLLKMEEFTEAKYNLLSDYTKAKFDIPITFIPELIEFMENIKDVVNGKKQAIVILDPYSVAITLMFENEVYKKVGFDVIVFSTEKEAVKWLKS